MDTAIIEQTKVPNCVNILQITDTHLFSDEHGTLLGLNTAECFKAVLQTIAQQSINFDAIFVTGDISQDYSIESYKRFASLISQLHSNVFFCPGNHDDGPLMYRVLGNFGINTHKRLIIGSWQFVFLNSEVYAVAHGWVEKSELEFLSKCVNEAPHLKTVVCVHHLPLYVNSQWLDTQTMHNQDEFNYWISRLQTVRLVLSGHVHQIFDKTIGNIRYIASPSTSIQFEPFSHNFSLDNQGPGWRYLSFCNDGTIDTQVYRLPNGKFTPDNSVLGY